MADDDIVTDDVSDVPPRAARLRPDPALLDRIVGAALAEYVTGTVGEPDDTDPAATN